MNYRETLDFLYSRLPLFTRIGEAAYRHDLHNTLALCSYWHNPQHAVKTIHIAGTNGKGSVSHMLAAIFQQAGYRTGLYTSPHLYDFRERIRVNGEMIPQQEVVDFTSQLQPLLKNLDPSFFEMTVAMAFEHFRNQQVDIAIIEAGLGGRLDSTNIIHPILSVITNIGWDHMHLLGDSLEKIAAEKAGIIKRETPAVIGEYEPATRKIFEEKARAENAALYFAEDHFQVKKIREQEDQLVITVSQGPATQEYRLDLPGHYQKHNLLTVLQAVSLLASRGWNLPTTAISEGLSRTKAITHLMGRWEKIATYPNIILDVAHNKNGIQEVLRQLTVTPYRHLHLILGMVKDKEVSTVLKLLPPEANYYFSQAHIPRALPVEELAQIANGVGLKGHVFSDVNEALQTARKMADPADLILVCGSVFLVAEVNRKMV